MSLRIYAPATSANMSVGFDSLGVAISPIDGSLLGDVIEISDSKSKFELENIGQFAKKLPKERERNIVYQAYALFSERLILRGGKVKCLRLVLEKNMPIGSGLGSSSCSIVAALVALNQFHDSPFSRMELLEMMGLLEGRISGGVHYDNVAPCYLGGAQLMLETQEEICQSLPFFDNWYWVLSYPGIKVSTAKARAILPDNYSRSDIIAQARYLGCFIHACHTQQEKLAVSMMMDVIAEPYREKLLPNFLRVKEQCLNLGALTVGISGSGPTIFAITSSFQNAHKISQYLENNYLQNSVGFSHVCKIDKEGAKRII